MTTLIKLGKYVQTPEESKRYSFDYTDWLDAGEIITAVDYEIETITDPPLLVTNLVHNDTLATWYVSGGMDGATYTVAIKITTSVAEKKQDAITIKVKAYT